MHRPTAALPGALILYQDPASQAVAAQVYGKRSQQFRPSVASVEAFIAPSLVNSWVNYDASTYSPVGYYKDQDGLVHLRGLIKNGTIGAICFALPAGYRPAFSLNIATASNAAFALCTIDTSGNVTAFSGSNTWFSLDNITFRAA